MKRVALAVAFMFPVLAAVAQQPLTEPTTVFVVTGSNITALYHRQGCPWLKDSSIFLPIKEAKARYFQPHCLCIAGYESVPPCTAPKVSLVGLSQAEIQAAFGPPSLAQAGVWNYDRPGGTIRISFKDGIVSETLPALVEAPPNVRRPAPATAAVAAADGSKAAAAPAPSTPPGGKGYTSADGAKVPSPTKAPSPPAGATAQCRDGTYSFSRSRSGTCSRHGGVARWL